MLGISAEVVWVIGDLRCGICQHLHIVESRAWAYQENDRPVTKTVNIDTIPILMPLDGFGTDARTPIIQRAAVWTLPLIKSMFLNE